MRNLKRTLSLVLAMALVVGMMMVGASAVSSDFVDGDEITYTEAAEIMTALGVFEGTDQGTFDPTGTLTREQAAAIVCRMLLGDDAENLTTNSVVFSDVAADRWSAGYIGYCAQQGILAGTGNGTFDPEGELTGLAFAKMLLVALGYDPAIERYVGNDWAVNVAAGAVNSGIAVSGIIMANAMTREQAAQMAYQTLEADMVSYASKGTTVVGSDGMQVIVGNTPAASVADRSGSGYITGGDNDEYQQFCERYFSNLKKNVGGEDDFGRPSNVWRLGNTTICTYTEEADATYTAAVELGTIYSDLGLSERTSATLITNGGSETTVTLSRGDETEIGGRGVLIEAYEDDGDVDLVRIDTYVAEVSTVDEGDDNEDPYIVLAALNGPATNEHFDTTAFEEDDVVLYTFARGEIQSVVLAEQITGTVDRVNASNNTFVLDGNTYRRSANYVNSDNDIGTANVGEDAVFYVDAYGYVVYVDDATASEDYAYVIDLGSEGSFTQQTQLAQLLLTDGTIVEVETAENYRTYNGNNLIGHIVSYVEDDGEYTLTNLSNAAASDTGLNIDNGVARMTINGTTVSANSATIFLVYDSETDEYSVYTGIRNVPNITGKGGNTTDGEHATDDDTFSTYYADGAAKVVYVEDADVEGSTGSVTFIVGDGELVRDSDGTYYEFDAVVDGEVTTVQTTQNYATSIYGDSSYAVGDNVTTNSSGYITNLSGLNVSETDGYQTYMGTKRVSNETVGLGNGWYTYSDDVVVARYDGSDLTISTISSIRDDANDMVVAVFDSGSVVAMLIMEDAVSESIVDDGDIDLNDAVKVDDQEALDAALENIGENDIILLSGGTYELSATVSGDLTIVGTGNVVIEAVDATSVSGIYMNSGNLTVSGVDFVAGSTEGYARGIHTAGGYNGTITVVDCTFDGLTTGIFLNGCNNITVESCTFTDCTAGIGVDSLTGTLQITDCTFSGNGEDIGIGAGVSAGDKVIGDIEGLNINDGRPKPEEPVEEPEV